MAGGGRMQEINVPVIFVIGLISILLLVVIVLGTNAWLRYEQQVERRERVYGARFPDHQALVEEQREGIESYRWVDTDQGTVAIPVQEAIDEVVEQYPQPRAGE